MRTLRFLIGLWVASVLAYFGAGCGQDGTGGSGGSGGEPSGRVSSSSSSSKVSSSSSNSSSNGAGGGDGGVPCMMPADCPATPNECVLPTCTAGQCGTSFAPAGMKTASQTPGDCKQNQCDGNGAITIGDDNSDIPTDPNPCTDDICVNGVPSNKPFAAGTMCGVNLICDGKGACVGCVDAMDCPGQDTDCQARTCTNGTCGVSNTAAGTPTSMQTAGDCKQNQCDGNGGVMSANDNADLPNDNNQCTGDTCVAGMPTITPLSAGNACNQNGGKVCDGSGACVECVVASTCTGQDTDCQTRTCTNGTCGFTFQPSGTPTQTQAAGDCKENQCNGSGGVIVANKDTDLPVDGNPCTADICMSGVASHPFLAAGTSCGGTQVCNGNGVCLGCLTATTCPGQDTDCQTRTCVNNACGFNNAPLGTPTQMQTAGDCQENQCNGTGGVMVVNKDLDLPNDNNQCTNDICTNGVPSHSPVGAGAMCNQNGGSLCNGIGSCVQCLVATDCPGQNTDCQTRTCSNSVCGVNNTPAGTPTQTQTTGDCKENQCNGSGGVMVANKDMDVPVDNNQCTSDVCTSGVPSNPPVGAGSACNQNGGVLCDFSGNCVQCLTASNCPGQDTDCQMRTCTLATCGVAYQASGTATQTQTPGDCKENQCNGTGGVMVANKDTDVPVDGNPCTNDVCMNGVPSNPNTMAGTSCGGVLVCNGSGSCVGCVMPSDCPGQNNECQTRTCTAGSCGFNYQLPGTVTSMQTPGDCKENQCDGAGGVMAANKDTDLPVDGNECTEDKCTGGVPSNPYFPSNTACTQGGLYCNGAGTCVQCISGGQCASGVCVNNVCQTASCNDGVLNGTETDVDCGGGTCGACASGKTCLVSGDCLSAKCMAGLCVDVLVISEIQTRGSAGGNDEFVEIYNPTNVAVTFDSTWKVSARSAVGTCTSNATAQRFAGTGQVIPPHGHLLYVNSAGYNGPTTGDATYTTGITDSSSVILTHGATVVDAVCFSYDMTTLTNLTTCATPYVCEGTPVSNLPHDNTGSVTSNVDVSLDRKPGGALGNGQDTNNSATDFANNTPSNPQNLASPVTP